MKSLKVGYKIKSIVVLTFAVMLLFTGCSKTSVTTEDFKALATEKGLVIEDAIDQFASYDYIKEATIAAPKDVSYQIEFYVLSDSSYAQAFFESNKVKFELNKSDGFLEASSSGENYASYSLTSGGKYMFVERIDTTVVYVNTDEEKKDTIDEFLKDLKY